MRFAAARIASSELVAGPSRRSLRRPIAAVAHHRKSALHRIPADRPRIVDFHVAIRRASSHGETDVVAADRAGHRRVATLAL